LIKKKIEDHPWWWHEVLSEALWAHRVSKHGATNVMSFELVYGQEATLPIEINLQSVRVSKQDALSVQEYTDLLMDNVDEVADNWLRALREIEKEKLQMAQAYNKRVREKSFQIGHIVWKTILPLGTRDQKFGKWSSGWEGPYKVTGVVPGNAYFIEAMEGKELSKALNGKYMKQYYPSIWQGSWKTAGWTSERAASKKNDSRESFEREENVSGAWDIAWKQGACVGE
jgi:hypothetical protein